MDAILRQLRNVFGIIIVLFILWCWQMMSLPIKMTNINYQDVKFKTGDMILFHAYDNINPIFIGTYWGHVGIVYIDPTDPDKRPLFFEATRINKNENCAAYNKTGIVISDLQTRLEKYKGIVVRRPLAKPIDTDIIAAFSGFIKFAKQNMFYNNDVIHNGFRKKFGERLHMGTNCGEITMLCLVKLGLLPEKILVKNIGHHLRYVVNTNRLQDNHYDERQRLIFDRF